jgi:hypothetical protein
MTKVLSVAVVGLALLLAVAAMLSRLMTVSELPPPGNVTPEPSDPGVVTVRQNEGQDIVQTLRDQPPAVHTLGVQGGLSPPFASAPGADAEVELETFVRTSRLIARIRVVKKSPVLKADRSWIDSTVHVIVLETIKTSDEPTLAVGQTMAFTEIGGELREDGKRIVAFLHWARPTRIDHEYLVFWSHNILGDGMTLNPTSTFERQGSHWVRLHSRERYGGIEKLDAEKVLDIVRAKARR